MKYSIFSFLFLFIAAGCTKESGPAKYACDTDNPLNKISWLKEMKDTLTGCPCTLSIFRGTYKNNTVYFQLMNDPLCDGIFGTTLYDCEGNPVKSFGAGDLMEYSETVTTDTLLYQCHSE